MLDLNKSTNFDPKKKKKSHFKVFVYVLYNTNDFMIQYDSYDMYTVSYDF